MSDIAEFDIFYCRINKKIDKLAKSRHSGESLESRGFVTACKCLIPAATGMTESGIFRLFTNPSRFYDNIFS
jgi:hypothetical protein